jgi:hypothetical protein
MANAIGLTKYIERHVYFDSPYIITGHCAESTGGMGSEKRHQGPLDKQAHLPSNTVDTWVDGIPFYWSGPTIYAQSICRALSILGCSEKLAFNFAYLYAFCFLFVPEYWQETLKAMRKGPQSGPKITLATFAYILPILVERSIRFIRNLPRYLWKKRRSYEAADIGQAINIVRAKFSPVLNRPLGDKVIS